MSPASYRAAPPRVEDVHGFEETVLGMARAYVTHPAQDKSRADRPTPLRRGQPVGDAVAEGLGDGLAEPLGDGVGVGPGTASCGASAWARLIAVSSRFCASP